MVSINLSSFIVGILFGSVITFFTVVPPIIKKARVQATDDLAEFITEVMAKVGITPDVYTKVSGEVLSERIRKSKLRQIRKD